MNRIILLLRGLGGGCCCFIVRLLGTNARLRYTGLGVVVVCTLVQFRRYRSVCEVALMASRSVIENVENDDDDDVSKLMLIEGNPLQPRWSALGFCHVR